MGSDLPETEKDSAPTFLVSTKRDEYSGNLDHVQIVKGWLDDDGETAEKVFDLICSDGRTIVSDRYERPVGSTVDIANATWTNTIGEPELSVFWQDPEFNPGQLAFYYIRILEIPTPRWTAYDAERYQVEAAPEVQMTLQERAYSSPIWYTPSTQN